MTTLISIGNSRGVRIPKTLIEQAKLANSKIELEVVPQGLLLKPIVSTPRKDWDTKIQEVQAQYATQTDQGVLPEALNHDDDIDDWQW